MMNEQSAKEFLQLLELHIKKYGEMKELELNKLEDLSKNHLEKLDEYVKREEAVLLTIRGLEVSWDNFLNSNNLSGKKMTDILPLLPEEMQENGQKMYKSLSGLLDEIRTVNRRCSAIVKLKIDISENSTSYTKNSKNTDYQSKLIASKV